MKPKFPNRTEENHLTVLKESINKLGAIVAETGEHFRDDPRKPIDVDQLTKNGFLMKGLLNKWLANLSLLAKQLGEAQPKEEPNE